MFIRVPAPEGLSQQRGLRRRRRRRRPRRVARWPEQPPSASAPPLGSPVRGREAGLFFASPISSPVRLRLSDRTGTDSNPEYVPARVGTVERFDLVRSVLQDGALIDIGLVGNFARGDRGRLLEQH